MITKGQILKYKVGVGSMKVRLILEDNVLLSLNGGFDKCGTWYSFSEIEELFEITVEKWVPKHNEEYFFINSTTGIANTYNTNNYNDVEHVKIGNIFKTKEEAQKMADKFKELLKQNV